MADIPKWNVSGDWFDVCSCDVPCPCIFAQAPTNGECEGVLAYHIRKGRYGGTPLDGMNALFLSYFKGVLLTFRLAPKSQLACIYSED